jgi:hypothetical protein
MRSAMLLLLMVLMVVTAVSLPAQEPEAVPTSSGSAADAASGVYRVLYGECER